MRKEENMMLMMVYFVCIDRNSKSQTAFWSLKN
jgi:hypothetical protein